MADNVNHPAHYTASAMEVIDVIEGLNLGYHGGNILKYVVRHRIKHIELDRQLEDLKKARWYLDRLIKVAENRLKPE